MNELLADLIFHSAHRHPDRPALAYRDQRLSYGDLATAVEQAARGFVGLGLARGERVGIYLEKRFENVVSMFAAAAAGGVFVPINPLLKPPQVAYLLRDCNVRVLVTSPERLRLLAPILAECHDLRHILCVPGDGAPPAGMTVVPWEGAFQALGEGAQPHRVIDADMAAILYTSGSTGHPKGVVLSHRNLITGARSVAAYLGNHADDRLLCALPLSFDYGLSQLTTAFLAGAEAVLINYLLPRDMISAVARYAITGLACVPPLWVQLAQLDWPDEARRSLRYATNSGGSMPRATLNALRARLPDTEIFLMYGLTEAFRSTYLPPAELDRRPDSIGKAIPNAEILVVRDDGELCGPGEPGELVHRGAQVALGYWNDAERSAERFRPLPGREAAIAAPEMAVWSGDTVRADEDGFLYFVGRRDDTIKTSGYRVSPTEVEEVVYGSGGVGEAAVLGLPHPILGQGIVAVVTSPEGGEIDTDAVLAACRSALPAFMVPQRLVTRAALPRTPNGKIDRRELYRELAYLFDNIASTPSPRKASE